MSNENIAILGLTVVGMMVGFLLPKPKNPEANWAFIIIAIVYFIGVGVILGWRIQ